MPGCGLPRAYLLLLVALLSGCVKYHPRPIDALRLERDYRARSLNAPGLRAFIQVSAAAKPVEWPPAKLDLDALTLVALYYSPDLDMARARLQTAEAGVLAARARPNPSVAAGGGYTNSPESPLVFRFDPTLTLETAGKRGYRILEAQKWAEAARLELTETGWKVRSRVRTAWMNHQVARRSVELLQAERAVRFEAAAILEKRWSVGEVSRPDVDLARVELIRTEVALKSAQGQVAESLPNLAAVLGLPVSAIEAAGFAELRTPPAEPALPLDQVQRAGLLHRVDVRRMLVEYAAAEAGLQLEVARQYPDIPLTPGYSFDEGHHKFLFGPSFSIPVFNRNQGPIAEAEGCRARVEAQFVALERQAISEMEIALARYRAALAELAEAEARLLTLQRDREAAMRRAVEAGEEDRLALAGVRLQSAIAARARLEAFRKAQAALGALEDAVQQPLEAGLSPIQPAPVNPREGKK